MLGDDAGTPPPIKGVCRSASIALRKANLAKETGDEDEELGQLRAFNRTVVNVLHLHPMYARKKEDEEVAGLDAKLPEVHRRIEALGGKLAPPPENNAEAAASGAAAGLVAGGPRGSLLERRRLSRAGSRAGSRVGSRAGSAAPSRDASPERAPDKPARSAAHTPHYVVTDLARRLAAVEDGEKARVSREAETEARLAELARRAETAETLVWELQEALRALSPALEGASGADADRLEARMDRLEARIGEVDDPVVRRAREGASRASPLPAPASPPGGRLADLEARVLPTRVAELEQRVAELADVSAASSTSTKKAPAEEAARDKSDANAASDATPRSPGEPFSAEVRDLRERVARLEHVDVGSAEWAHAAEAKAATALSRVAALEKAVDAVAKASAELGSAPEEASDAQARAAVAALQARVRRAEAAAAEALDLAASTSPGTARAKSAVPELRSRIVEVEAGVEAQAARVSEVETRVNRMASAPRAENLEALEARLAAAAAAAARDAAREATAASAKLPTASSEKPAGGSSERGTRDPRVTELEDTVESLRQARAVDQARFAELEASAASAAAAAETTRDAVAEAEARHREAAGEQADAVGEVVAAMSGAVAALPKLDRRMQALEDARAEHAEALATSAARTAALETDTETAARLCSKLAERVRATRADLGELRETTRQSVSATAVKSLVAAVSVKVSRLAQETADAVDSLKRRERNPRAERAKRGSGERTPASSRTFSRESRSPPNENAPALAENTAALAERALERAESACAAAKKAGALAEALQARVRRLEGTKGDAIGDDDTAGSADARAETEPPERPAPSGSPVPRGRDWEARADALGAAVATAAEGIASLRERLEVVVASRNEDWLAKTLAPPESGAGSHRGPSAAAFGAADAAAGAAETLAEAVARLHARMAAVESRSRATEPAADAKAGVGVGAEASRGSSDAPDAPRDRSEEDAGTNAAGKSGRGAAADPGEGSRDARGAIAVEGTGDAEAAAATGESADPSDVDLVQRARLAASIARRAVQDEAARLGITLGGEDAGDANPGDAEGRSAEDASAELSQRAEAANAADRELAAELATVCALVEKEEARRETLRAAFVTAGDVVRHTGTDPGVADDAVAVAARREWATCMEAQLRRLRAAAREAEARNAAAAEELARRPEGLGTRSGAMRAARAAAERREAAIADRLARVARRVDAAFGPEIDGVASFDKENARGKRLAPWGAGPGLKGTSFGSKDHSTRHSGSRVDTALSALERRVEALARAAAIGAPILGAVPAGDAPCLSLSSRRDPTLDGGSLELVSLRRMMRQAQTELGALSGRIETVETKVREVGRLERDLRAARLTGKRADALSSLSANVAADAARASERAAAAEREAAASRAHYADLSDSVASQREGLRRVALQVDGLARDVDVSAKSAEAAADRARGQARSANASAKSAEARTVALAGALGRVARHVGLRGVGDALRTAVLWEDVEVEGSRGPRDQEDAEDRFEITAFASDAA